MAMMKAYLWLNMNGFGRGRFMRDVQAKSKRKSVLEACKQRK